MPAWAWLNETVPHLTTAVLLLVTVLAGAHAVLNKRDVRAAIGWVGLIALVPGVGAVLYALLGVNRIARRASKLREQAPRVEHPLAGHAVPREDVVARLPEDSRHLASLSLLVDRTTSRRLLSANLVEPLRDGDEAYPAMIAAIEQAQRSIALATYIFDVDAAGHRFIEALVAARARGVDVRVLVDDAGARYSRPPADRLLRRAGVRTARFLPMLLPWAWPYSNLRNHRKLLVVDGRVGFTGGMNIRGGCLLREAPRHPTADLHFRVRGPVVAHLLDVFEEDWRFSRGEALEGEAWALDLEEAGGALARGIADGPDEDLDAMRWVFLGAIASARRSLRIVTPYFLPDEAIVTALNVAAMRGVAVDIVLPERGNLRFVEWAMHGELWKVLGRGCRVWLTPPPFDHGKLLVVDAAMCVVGSPNWDPRSLRLNFELGLEIYDQALAETLEALVAEKIAGARQLDAAALEAQPRLLRLRNGVARLFTPYL